MRERVCEPDRRSRRQPSDERSDGVFAKSTGNRDDRHQRSNGCDGRIACRAAYRIACAIKVVMKDTCPVRRQRHVDRCAERRAGCRWRVDVCLIARVQLRACVLLVQRIAGRQRRQHRPAPQLRDVLDSQLPDLGDDLVKTAGVGEHIVDWPLEGAVPLGDEYYQSTRLIAQRGWQMMEHSFDEANHVARADVWERVHKEFPLTNLRWTIDHVNTITPATIARMKTLGVGVRAHGWRVLSGSKGLAGPPYRLLLDSGIHVGAGMDGAQASPINPWLHVYYMVTGKNVRGDVINDGQQITRQEAVWLYTGANGWFSREEDTLGTIEAGRLADLVVLNADVFDPKAVPDESIRRVHSELTILGGRVVYGDLKRRR